MIVCSYALDRWELLKGAVQATLDQATKSLQVVLVVDHNPELLRRCADTWSEITVVANEHRRGLASARNTGVRHATGSVVAFLDDDARPEPGWLDALLEPYDDPRVVGTGGLAVPRWEGAAPGWLPAEFLWTVGCSYRGLPEHRASLRNPIGANMSFRREVFEHVGGFVVEMGRLGKLPMGCEETEFAIRVQAAMPEAVVMHVCDARIEHLVPAERATWSYFRSRCFAEGRSKALVAEAVGNNSGLASERRYTMSVLPRAAFRGLRDAIRGDVSGLLRTAAILAGLTITAAGYLRGRLAGVSARAGRTRLRRIGRPQ